MQTGACEVGSGPELVNCSGRLQVRDEYTHKRWLREVLGLQVKAVVHTDTLVG